jgi:glycosyltransferase involved in cell wall biosynthesis
MRAFRDTIGRGMTQDRRIAVVTQGVKLADEVRGYTRFRKVAEMLVEAGYEVDLITSSFQHWDKEQRDTARQVYQELPYSVVFVSEPGYARNLDLRRIHSHRVLARNLQAHFDASPHAYDLVYSEIPPNDMALVCARAARDWGVPYVADINDLWPEAMRMALDIPVLSDIVFRPFARQAREVYNLLSAAVGTSDEYAMRPARDREEPYPHVTVYVGNDLRAFDDGVCDCGAEIEKPEGAFWVTYTGTLGASYDIATLIAAAEALKDFHPLLRVKVLGDGPDRENLQRLAEGLNAPVDFLGYVDYAHMAAWLAKSDVTVNSLVKRAPQSVVTKIGDYLASGHPMINTGSSPEMRALVQKEGFGVNVEAEDVSQLAEAIHAMVTDPRACREMGAKARSTAERDFDQRNSYQKIVDLVGGLLA